MIFGTGKLRADIQEAIEQLVDIDPAYAEALAEILTSAASGVTNFDDFYRAMWTYAVKDSGFDPDPNALKPLAPNLSEKKPDTKLEKLDTKLETKPDAKP
ncbi:hypothetical protein N7493_010873 [Penicillium malachiteum]|uniref:Uncharacterized protein n=1 Tax=Penicillium malachiteum TaxID=1324776 RepID=A0AAD6HB26_9EURO|nr:hypothetical protein N7493_010873 [Penicillium malachiteum]